MAGLVPAIHAVRSNHIFQELGDGRETWIESGYARRIRVNDLRLQVRPLADRGSGFGADGAMQRVGHEQDALGLGPIALGVPNRQLIGRQ